MAKNKKGKINRKDGDLNDVIAKLQKAFGEENRIGLFGDLDIPDIERVSTGSLSLDIILSGGIPLGRIVELYGENSSGKAQPLNSKILTPHGWTTMGDIESGDIVCCPDGSESTVIATYPQGNKDVYEITFSDKSKVRCCKEHLWTVQQRGTDLWETITTEDILNGGPDIDNGRGFRSRRYRIPNVKHCHFNKYDSSDLTIPPYIFGLLLGDGSFAGKNGVKFTSSEEYLVNIMKDYAASLDDVNFSLASKNGRCIDYNFAKFSRGHKKCIVREYIEEMGLGGKLSADKFIPEQYLLNTIENRIALAQGLMDSDGFAPKKGMYSSFSTTSKTVSEQFEFLMKSLGCRVKTSSRITKYTSATGKKQDGKRSYSSTVMLGSMKFDFFTLPRKKERTSFEESGYRDIYIESVELVGNEECKCISIGHPDSLYITDDFVVTHNTSTSLQIMKSFQQHGKTVAFLDLEHALDPKYARSMGVDMDSVVFAQLEYGEQAFEAIAHLANTKEIDLIVVDSVAAMQSQDEITNPMGNTLPGGHARLVSQGLKKITHALKTNNATVIFINQQRMTMQGNKVTTGGKSIPYYASLRMEIKKTYPYQTIEAGGVTVAEMRDVIITKTKVSQPYETCSFYLRYGEGVDNLMEIIDISLDLGLISKGGSWYTIGETKVQGPEKARNYLLENPQVAIDLENQIRDIVFNNDEENDDDYPDLQSQPEGE